VIADLDAEIEKAYDKLNDDPPQIAVTGGCAITASGTAAGTAPSCVRNTGRQVGETTRNNVAEMTLPPHVSAIVFDCDRPLLDTETCWSRAKASLFADYGFGFGAAEKDLLIGRTHSRPPATQRRILRPPEYRGPASGRACSPRRGRTRNTGRAHVRCSVAGETVVKPLMRGRCASQ
jgi:hypothetical protein